MAHVSAFTFPRISTARKGDDQMAGMPSPSNPTCSHSRDSSGASNTSSPVTPTFSARSHGRYPSASSLGTTPDSPAIIPKSALHDLVEDPAEREDIFGVSSDPSDEPLCICDTSFCEHRGTTMSLSAVLPRTQPEWTMSDETFGDGELLAMPCPKRRRSGEGATDSIAGRMSRRWPSVSQRWRDLKPTTSISQSPVRSAPPSRTSSLKSASVRQSLATHLDRHEADERSSSTDAILACALGRGRSRTCSQVPSPGLEIQIPTREDPIDREELARTPLLPPLSTDHRGYSNEELSSPLQSPSVAPPSASTSAVSTPASTPVIPGLPTPPLSAKPSISSFGVSRASYAVRPSVEIPPMTISEEDDPWAMKLGHADFHIKPRPYMPATCDFTSCTRLLEDWEMARVEFMRYAAHIRENFGPTSLTYKLAEEKWSDIDARWRANLDQANAEAVASGEIPVNQSLAEVQPPAQMPALNDPSCPAKFPGLEDGDACIVGPMVKYAKIQRQHPTPAATKRSGFFRIFSEPATLFGGKSPFNTRH